MHRSASARSIPIVDAHHHFWDLERKYHPWLCDEPLIPFRYGDYRAVRRSYLPEDYARDASSFDVVASVTVEAEWDPVDPIGETRWIDAIADEDQIVTASGHVEEDRDDETPSSIPMLELELDLLDLE